MHMETLSSYPGLPDFQCSSIAQRTANLETFKVWNSRTNVTFTFYYDWACEVKIFFKSQTFKADKFEVRLSAIGGFKFLGNQGEIQSVLSTPYLWHSESTSFFVSNWNKPSSNFTVPVAWIIEPATNSWFVTLQVTRNTYYLNIKQ